MTRKLETLSVQDALQRAFDENAELKAMVQALMACNTMILLNLRDTGLADHDSLLDALENISRNHVVGKAAHTYLSTVMQTLTCDNPQDPEPHLKIVPVDEL